MLTWLLEEPELFRLTEPYIGPEDFTEDLYRKAAEAVFTQYREEGVVNPARIISMFDEEEQQQEIAGLFHARLEKVTTQPEREKALKETVIRLKENSISYRSRHLEPSDMEGLQKLVADKKNMQQLQKVEFSW